MLIKHEVQGVVKGISFGELSEAFSQAVTLFRDSSKIHGILVKLRNHEIDEDDACFDLEDYGFFDVDALGQFCQFANSKSPMVNKYTARMMVVINDLSVNLTRAVDCCFLIQEEEVETLIKQSYKVASSVLFFLIGEFDLVTLSECDPSSNYDIDEIVSHYCSATSLDPVAFAKDLVSYSDEFKIRIELFDAMPELEDVFLKLMGPNMVNIDPAYLTIDMAQRLVEGKITPDELVEEMKAIIDSEMESE